MVHCTNIAQTLTDTMRAAVFEQVGRPLRTVERPIPQAQPGQLLLRVHACGVCRTDLHLLDGELEIAQPPRVLGHLELAPRMPVRTTVTSYPLGEAAQALEDLRAGRFTGAAVIVP